MKSTLTLALVAAAGTAFAGDSIWINEFQPNPSGSDPAQVDFEIRGTAGTMFTGVVYSIEGDFAAPNFIDRLSTVSGTFDANGLLNVQIDDLENPSFTVVLASGGSALEGDQVDGMTDISATFGTVFDAITINDEVGDEAFSFVPFLGVGTNFVHTGDEPGLVFRDSVDASIIYAINDPAGTEAFDQFGNTYDLATAFFTADGMAIDLSTAGNVNDLVTFGAANYTTIPTPGAIALAGLGGLAAARRRRA